ncbi:MAG: tRNA (guanosine(46)-N7)-methyltransferase TrmB [Planctomycetales bacterium]|nr:tRNA (guanosine(46)-N7)-methyltransferase TrmB [Planctomycetales bacterium]
MTLEPDHNAMPQSSSRISAEVVVARDLFDQPATWPELVSGSRPVELEIGSGKGLFLVTAASQRTAHEFVGVELAAKFANRAAARIAKHGLETRVKMLRGDAQQFLQVVVPDESVAGIHVYFPDPWWRNKHKKRRVLNDQTLGDIQRALVPGGQFHFWTDVLDYYEHICARTMDTTQLAGPAFVPQRVAQHTMDYTTHFERRARAHSQPVYRAIFTKLSN